jgi:hypothetical protein
MGELKSASEVRQLDAKAIQAELKLCTRLLDQNDREKIRLEEHRRRLFIRAGKLGISQRTMAPWVGLTGARIAQIVTGVSPAKKAAARKASATKKAQAKIDSAPGRPTPAPPGGDLAGGGVMAAAASPSSD